MYVSKGFKGYTLKMKVDRGNSKIRMFSISTNVESFRQLIQCVYLYRKVLQNDGKGIVRFSNMTGREMSWSDKRLSRDCLGLYKTINFVHKK